MLRYFLYEHAPLRNNTMFDLDCLVCNFQVIVHEVPGQELEVEVYDKDPDQDDFLGRYHQCSLFYMHIFLPLIFCHAYLSENKTMLSFLNVSLSFIFFILFYYFGYLF